MPFGEYLPLPQFFALFGLKQFVPGADGWQAGDGHRLMSLPNMPAFLALICYEAIFSGDLGPDTAKAQFILNITNDAWFDGSIGLAQHADHARLRAVEEGLPLVRVGNSGITEARRSLGPRDGQPAARRGGRARRRAGQPARGDTLHPLRLLAVLDRHAPRLGLAVWGARRGRIAGA